MERGRNGKVDQLSQAPKGQADLEITPAMIEAGTDRLVELLEAGTGSAYVVSEVFQAMWKARVGLVRQSRCG